MIAAVDVDYRADATIAACVVFRDWSDATEVAHYIDRGPIADPYIPGEFYRRELPALLRVLSKVPDGLGAVIIDGYVWLAGEDQPGLGAHLYDALNHRVAVIGVAKAAFHTSSVAIPIFRGTSKRPLLITSTGIDVNIAAVNIQRMHGASRVPTLLKRVDQLCRQA
jgi:deoxyribonuclease V